MICTWPLSKSGIAGDSRVAHKIVIQVRIERRVDGIGRHCDEQRVAVRRRPHDKLRADIGAGAGPVFDDERLRQTIGKPLPEQARHDVGRAAGGNGDHEVHRPGRIILCRNRAGQ